MKKHIGIFAIALSVLMFFTLSGCGSTSDISEAEGTTNNLPQDTTGNVSNTSENTEGTAPLTEDTAEGIGTKSESSQLLYLSFFSEALGQEMKLNIYLPANYSNETQYPVLYMIHGYTGDQNVWMPGLKLEKKADELIADGKIQPLIIVSPDIDNSYGINSSKTTRQIGSTPSNSLNEGMYEEYLIKDVVAYVDSNYSTIPSKEGRYIGGLSMGGYAALHLAFVHTDMFCKVGGHSPALFINEFPSSLDYWLYPDENTRKQTDPVYIAQEKDLTSLEVYLDCGSEDSYKFYEGCEDLQQILQANGVKSEYHLNAGGHDGEYWINNSENYLMFYAGK